MDVEIKGSDKERLPRGFAPPAVRLSEAITLVHKVNDRAGGSANYDTFSQITGNTKTSSTFQRKVAALRSYGLIEDRDNAVVLSELGNRITTPRDDRDDADAAKEAMLRIDILKRTFERYRGKLIPEGNFLTNILIQEIKVPREVAQSWADCFRDAIECAKLVFARLDGKLQIAEDPIVSGNVSAAAEPATASLQIANFPTSVAPNSESAMPIPLGKGRIAHVILPDDWTAKKDLKRFLKMLQLSLGEEDDEALEGDES